MIDYQDFLQNKFIRAEKSGKEVSDSDIHPRLFAFQRDITRWAIRKGRALIAADTGLGKTFCQIEWARLVSNRTLIIAPLSVARQTVREAKKIDVEVKYVRHQSEVDGDGIYITNYEMIEHFDAERFPAVVLDESSILKALDGSTRKLLTDMFAQTPYRLCCTATPAPNDISEIGNHAEFLGVMTHNQMLATFFIHANHVKETAIELGNGKRAVVRKKQPGAKGQEWRLRNHARDTFYRWLASWCMSIRKPSDLGYKDDGFILPALNIQPYYEDADFVPEGQLFFTGMKGIQDRTRIRRGTLSKRLERTLDLVQSNDEQWVVWCGLNDESHAIIRQLGDGIEVEGSDTPEFKAQAIEDFQDGKYRVLVVKPRIAGFGLNLQNAHNMAFLGLGDSWEMYYQCIRREWRFGQKHPVNVYIVLSEMEREIFSNVMRKEGMAAEMKEELINMAREYEEQELGLKGKADDSPYQEMKVEGETWTALLGDSAKRLAEIADETIDLSIYSPPFADLFTYSNSPRDLGNSQDWSEFFNHYAFIIREVLRVTKPGRTSCVHTADIPALLTKDGYIGMRDFPGAVIRAHEHEGWIYTGYAVVAKNPQAQAIRTKSKALLFAQLRKDSADSRPAILDRVLFFRKPGDNAIPITPVINSEIDNEKWIEWAGGIWTGIHESDVLRYHDARDLNDEKHICPLQLGTIERCLKLYSNPDELVLSPFMGIGSEVYQAVRFGRRGIGIELKPSYFDLAVKNLKTVEIEKKRIDLFQYAENQDET